MTASSWEAGWRSLLLRAYRDPLAVDELTTPATADHLIVLVTEGACDIECRYRGTWQRAHYEAGDIGMTAAGQEATLRWRGDTAHSTLQLHLPSATIRRVSAELATGDPDRVEMPSTLRFADPLIQHVMLDLARALEAGVSDLYAEVAGELLAAHLLVRHASPAARRTAMSAPRDAVRARRADAFLREHLAASVSLAAIADAAGVSRFHVVRLFTRVYGETPFKRLARLRMEEAQRRLARGHESVTEVAASCGYDNPAHFASAFRRVVGVAPGRYRRRRAIVA